MSVIWCDVFQFCVGNIGFVSRWLHDVIRCDRPWFMTSKWYAFNIVPCKL